MSVEIEISLGLADLKVNLGEFLSRVQNKAGATKYKEARQALRDAVGEIRKSSDTAVDTCTPLYGIPDDVNIAAKLGNLQASFKNSYLKNVDTVRTDCHIVKNHLTVLLNKKEPFRGYPF